MDSAEHNDAKETAAAYQAQAALTRGGIGQPGAGACRCRCSNEAGPEPLVRTMAALALARAGDTAGAEKLAAELDKTFPLDTLVQRYWLPTIRAAVALQRKDPNRAVELLQVASAIELGDVGNLLPVYLRGEAYLMLHDGNRAAAEFQKFIDHRGLVGNFPWGALARLQLGSALRFVGRQDQSQDCLPGFPHALERRRPRHPHPEGSQGGIRETAVIPTLKLAKQVTAL